MANHYILIDYENVQPAAFPQSPNPAQVHVELFLGPTQSKVPVSLAQSLQQFGPNVTYFERKVAGANACDFHMAFRMGALSTSDPKGAFHIISNDKGFDSLIMTLRANKRLVFRYNDLNAIPCLKPAATPAKAPKPATPTPTTKAPALTPEAEVALAHLQKTRKNAPRKLTTLQRYLLTHFKSTYSAQQIEQIIANLVQSGKIAHDTNQAIKYNF